MIERIGPTVEYLLRSYLVSASSVPCGARRIGNARAERPQISTLPPQLPTTLARDVLFLVGSTGVRKVTLVQGQLARWGPCARARRRHHQFLKR